MTDEREDHAHPPVEGVESELGDVREHEELAVLRAAVERAERERDDAVAKLARTLADFDNHRKRTREDAAAAREKAKADVLAALLDVLDNFDRAVSHGGDAEAVREGLLLIQRQLAGALEREGLRRIPAEGLAFDPLVHEAVARVPTSEAKEGTVLAEVARGYTLNGRVLRPARVTVATSPQSDSG